MATTRKQRPSHRRWLLPLVIVVGWLVVFGVGGGYQAKLQEVSSNDPASFLPETAESTQVLRKETLFNETRSVPTIVVYERQSGITEADRTTVQRDIEQFSAIDGIDGPVSPAIPSENGKALQVFVPVTETGEFFTTTDAMEKVLNSHPDLAGYVTGPGGLSAALFKSFEGIDGILLAVAGTIVLLILVLVYRSPILPLVVAFSVMVALALASFAVYWLTKEGIITLDGQSQGILSVLVFGAATDYALLLVARFREELHHTDDKYLAMRRAYAGVWEPIAASGATVILALLCLLLGDLNSNKSLGPVGAIGIAAALATGLTLLPALLVLGGRAAFWPFRPKNDDHAEAASGYWVRVTKLLSRRPRRVWVGCLIVLGAMALTLPQLKATGVTVTDSILSESKAVDGQEVLRRHFPTGGGSPITIINQAGSTDAVVSAVKQVPNVGEVTVDPKIVNGLQKVDIASTAVDDDPQSEATVRNVRNAVDSVDGAFAQVGGTVATTIDSNDSARHDRNLIIPVAIAVITVLLALLLRSIIAPLLLISTVVISFAAALGISAVVFNELFGFAGADVSFPLLAFVFLVAFGVDYNIFLMTRVREEAKKHGTRQGTLRAVRVTGGVITSAGLVLAATFGALGVLPVLFLAQLGFAVAFGVLLDTLVVRSLLVPALTMEIGRRSWWPSALARGKK